MDDELKIKVFTTPPYKSEVNGQIERFHSTLSEIMRCLKADGINRTFEDLLQRAIKEYHHSIHSVTGKKPIELFLGRVPYISPEEIEKIRLNNIEKLKIKQMMDTKHHNNKNNPIKTYKAVKLYTPNTTRG